MKAGQWIYNKQKGEYCEISPHQEQAYEHLIDTPQALLFMEMGTNKTIIALSYIYEMIYREAAFCKCLVIAPGRVARITWVDELQAWSHVDGARWVLVDGTPKQRIEVLNSDNDIFIISVDNIAWLCDLYPDLPFGCVVIDELDTFKGRGSLRFKKLRKAIKNVFYRVGMTGTPTPNNLIDLWAQVLLIDGGERLEPKWGKFLDKYFTTRGNGQIVYEYLPRPGAAKTISAKISDIVYEAKARDVLTLPPLEVHDEHVKFSAPAMLKYSTLAREFYMELSEKDLTAKGAADVLNKCLQVCGGAVYTDPPHEKNRAFEVVNSIKIEALRLLIEKYEDENIIVVYQFQHELKRLLSAFPQARQLRKGKAGVADFRDWNEGKIKMLLIQPASSCYGLNLQHGGRRLVWFTLTWSLGNYEQINARLWRRGQTQTVHVHRLVVPDTVDMRVCRKLADKDSTQSFLMGELKELRRLYG